MSNTRADVLKWLREQIAQAVAAGVHGKIDAAAISVEIGKSFEKKFPNVVVVEDLLIVDPSGEEWEIEVNIPRQPIEVLNQASE